MTAITVTPHGRAILTELSPQRTDYLREMAIPIECESNEIDSIAQNYPRDTMMVWFGPDHALENTAATNLAGRPLRGVVVFTGPCRAVDLDLTPLSPRCMFTIHDEVRRTGSGGL